jgi:hypothetical protein
MTFELPKIPIFYYEISCTYKNHLTGASVPQYKRISPTFKDYY